MPMNKNILIGFLALLLLIAGGFIIRDIQKGNIEKERDTEEVEEEQNTEGKVLPRVEVNQSTEERVSIVGQWHNNDDPQSTLTFQADGSFVDIYGGGAIREVGTYDSVDSVHDLPSGTEYDPEATFLRQTFGNESYYYEVLVLDSTSLELLPLSGGTRVLEYTRADS